MDLLWERSIPFVKVKEEKFKQIFFEFNKSKVIDFEAISLGCRNSNYIIKTNEDKYLLRICPLNDRGYINEQAANEALINLIHIPKLLFTLKEDRIYLLYEYIEAESMQKIFSDKLILDDELIIKVAKQLAFIHNVNRDNIKKLNELDLPPFETWYDLFLNNENCIKRLGTSVIYRIEKLIMDNKKRLNEIEQYYSMIHGDCRPANMLVTEQKEVYLVDWEYFMYGHTLADVGQFFRYFTYFKKHQFSLFEMEYNKHAKIALPNDWISLCKLRDLINPLQMIGGNSEQPNKYLDLKRIILDILNYFNY